MSSRARGRRQRRGTTRGELQQLRQQLRVDVDGRKFTPHRTPPRITDVPWNSLIVTRGDITSATATTPTSYSVHDVYLFINDQIGQAANGLFSMEFRFSRVEAWNFGLDASLIMDVWPLQTYSAIIPCMARLEDQPGKNQWAAVGFEWPRSHRNYIFQDVGLTPPTTNANICRIFSNVVSSPFWVRWHLLWRYTVTQPPSLTRGWVPTGFEQLSINSDK